MDNNGKPIYNDLPEVEVKKKFPTPIIIVIIAILLIGGGLIYYFIEIYDSTGNGGKEKTTIPAVINSNFDKLSIDSSEAYAETFYLAYNTLFAIPKENSTIQLNDKSTIVEGNKVYRIASDVEKVFTPKTGQNDFYTVLYLSNGEVYEVTLYEYVEGAPLSAHKKNEYNNVKEILEVSFGHSNGYIVINKDNQILANYYANGDGGETSYIYYDEKDRLSTNNVNGDIIEINKTDTRQDGERKITTFEIRYINQLDEIEVDTTGLTDTDVIPIAFEKQDLTYVYGEY